MICFRDKSFCGSDCINSDCTRYFSDADWEEAKKWWGADENIPIAFDDFAKDCPAYVAPKPKEECA